MKPTHNIKTSITYIIVKIVRVIAKIFKEASARSSPILNY